MGFFGVIFSGRVAFAFFSNGMNDNGPANGFDGFEEGNESVEVVSVDGTEVSDAHFFEE